MATGVFRHRHQFRPRRVPPFGVAAGGGPVALAGESAGAAATSGDLTVTRPLTGASDGLATTAAALTVLRPLAGESAGVATATGALTVLRPLAGASDGLAVTAAALTVLRPLAGASAGVATATGTITGGSAPAVVPPASEFYRAPAAVLTYYSPD